MYGNREGRRRLWGVSDGEGDSMQSDVASADKRTPSDDVAENSKRRHGFLMDS